MIWSCPCKEDSRKYSLLFNQILYFIQARSFTVLDLHFVRPKTPVILTYLASFASLLEAVSLCNIQLPISYDIWHQLRQSAPRNSSNFSAIKFYIANSGFTPSNIQDQDPARVVCAILLAIAIQPVKFSPWPSVLNSPGHARIAQKTFSFTLDYTATPVSRLQDYLRAAWLTSATFKKFHIPKLPNLELQSKSAQLYLHCLPVYSPGFWQHFVSLTL